MKEAQTPILTPTSTTPKGLELQRETKKTATEGIITDGGEGEGRVRKRFNVNAVSGLQAIASTQEATANICTPMLLEVPNSLS